MSELYDLYRRNFPFCVREESVVHSLLDSNHAIVEYADGRAVGAAVMEKNNILLLCVDRKYRNSGIGSHLLTKCEALAKESGYSEITIGAGEHYIMPGIPAVRPVIPESLQPDEISPALEDHTDFFIRRGYIHSWDCNCFDMRGEFAPPAARSCTYGRYHLPVCLLQ